MAEEGRPVAEQQLDDSQETSELVRRALRLFCTHSPQDFRQALESAMSHEDIDLRSLLGDALIFNPNPVPEPVLAAVDRVLSREAAARPAPVREFPGALVCALGENSLTKVVVWRGDITSLGVDCVVNAANEEGLGCFQPSHRCIDNVIHRAAGPRLREACRREMKKRPREQLPAGEAPVVTEGFNLPAKWVLHVTGPALRYGSKAPTAAEERLLSSCYTECLDAAVRISARSIAFCCISTGLFSYPGHLAANTALETVKRWLNSHRAVFDTIVFDVFTPQDDKLYHTLTPTVFPTVVSQRSPVDSTASKMSQAYAWLSEADAILVCAGAGMSVKEGEMVYTNPDDFARFYPNFRLTREWGYKTAYDCMGIFHDPQISQAYRWGFWATHAMNQRYRFQPNDGYRAVRELIGDKDYFVYTSNADGCFVTAGFEEDRVFTPQGDWQWFQCAKPCRQDAFWPSKPMLDRAAETLNPDGGLPATSVPKCAFCHGDTFPNVRGGDWFLETPHDPAKRRYKSWVKSMETSHKRVAILEVGAGFNTPGVTRFPMESLARRLPGAALVRVNPTEADVPFDVPRAVGIAEGWEAVRKLLEMRSR